MRPRTNRYHSLLFGLCAIVALLQACEEPVDLGFDLPKSRLVINASILPGQPVTLRVSATRTTGMSAVNIDSARVTLFEGSELAEELTYFPGRNNRTGGEYRTTRFLPREGKSYTIHVSASGYDPVMAVSSIPAPIPITSLGIYGLSSAERSGGFTVYDYKLVINYPDPLDETNYYDIRISQKVVPFSVNHRGDTVLAAAYLKSVDTPQKVTEANTTLSVLVKDTGGQDSVTIHLQSRLISSGELLGGIVAELRTVSPEYYFYRLSLGPSGSNNFGGGLREPIILYNNVESGLGIFAGYNSVMQQITFSTD